MQRTNTYYQTYHAPNIPCIFIEALQSGKADLQGKLAEIRKRGMKRSPDKRKIIKRLEAKVIASRKENAQLFLQLERSGNSMSAL